VPLEGIRGAEKQKMLYLVVWEKPTQDGRRMGRKYFETRRTRKKRTKGRGVGGTAGAKGSWLVTKMGARFIGHTKTHPQ